MKILIAAFAIAFATPAAAQPAADAHSGHGQSQHQGQGQSQHQGHGGHQPGQHREGHDCPCCRPAANGQRPDCCARMHQQQGGQDGHRGHNRH